MGMGYLTVQLTRYSLVKDLEYEALLISQGMCSLGCGSHCFKACFTHTHQYHVTHMMQENNNASWTSSAPQGHAAKCVHTMRT